MTSDPNDALWPDDAHRFALEELAELSGWSEAELVELVEYGALTPAAPDAGGWTFGARSIMVARTAFRLRETFELEPHGVAVLLAYLDRIRELEQQLAAARARLPR